MSAFVTRSPPVNQSDGDPEAWRAYGGGLKVCGGWDRKRFRLRTPKAEAQTLTHTRVIQSARAEKQDFVVVFGFFCWLVHCHTATLCSSGRDLIG